MFLTLKTLRTGLILHSAACCPCYQQGELNYERPTFLSLKKVFDLSFQGYCRYKGVILR